MVKVVLIGLGALGLTYAVKLKDKCDLNILVDELRLEKYIKNRPIFNGVEQEFKYVLPSEKFSADIIIIAVKSQGLSSAINSIKNFVSEKTRIISLVNGISSERKIKEVYPYAKILKSYFIGHSAVRDGNVVTQDGIGEIVIERDDYIEEFFKSVHIDYKMPRDIEYQMWLKFTFNIFSNQTSAILNMNFGQLKRNNLFKVFAKKIVSEIKQIALKEGIKNIENLDQDALNLLNLMCDDGKTSMHQDILAMRRTEVDIFGGEIIELGKKYGIETPYNQALYDLVRIKEEDNEHSVYTG